jgi:hypothetical protein
MDSIHAVVRTAEPGSYRLEGAVRPATGGGLEFEGSARSEPAGWSFEATAEGRLAASEVLRGARADSISIHATARRGSEGWDRLDADFRLTGGAWRRVSVDTVVARFGRDAAGLRLDTLHVASNVMTLDGGGSLPASAPVTDSIHVEGGLVALDPFLAEDDRRALSVGESALRATLTGRADSIQLATSAEVRAFVFGNVRTSGIDVTGTARLEPPFGSMVGFQEGTMEVRVDRLIVPDTDVRSLQFTAVGGRESVTVEASAVVDDTRQGDLTVVIDPRPDQAQK